MEKEELLKELKIALWNYWHRHRGTASHLYSKARVFQIADKLQSEYGVSRQTLIDIENKAKCERSN